MQDYLVIALIRNNHYISLRGCHSLFYCNVPQSIPDRVDSKLSIIQIRHAPENFDETNEGTIAAGLSQVCNLALHSTVIF